MAGLKDRYLKEIVPAMMKKYEFKNPMEVPKLEKIIINRGVGEAAVNSKIIDKVAEELAMISGQKPLITKAKKSIAGFKLREGIPIGMKVTLRGKRMYDFMDKLTNICLPKIRDFKGVNPKSFDGHGNYTMGIKEQLIFPEVDYDKVDKARGMDITIVTTALDDDKARELLHLMGVPFQK